MYLNVASSSALGHLACFSFRINAEIMNLIELVGLPIQGISPVARSLPIQNSHTVEARTDIHASRIRNHDPRV
jgi:hypothetical protein